MGEGGLGGLLFFFSFRIAILIMKKNWQDNIYTLNEVTCIAHVRRTDLEPLIFLIQGTTSNYYSSHGNLSSHLNQTHSLSLEKRRESKSGKGFGMFYGFWGGDHATTGYHRWAVGRGERLDGIFLFFFFIFSLQNCNFNYKKNGMISFIPLMKSHVLLHLTLSRLVWHIYRIIRIFVTIIF